MPLFVYPVLTSGGGGTLIPQGGEGNISAGAVQEQSPSLRGDGFPTEFVRTPVSRAGKMRRLRITVTSNSLDGDVVFTVLVNGAATALTLIFSAAETGVKSIDLTTVSIAVSSASGDGFSLKVDASAATLGAADYTGSYEYVPD